MSRVDASPRKTRFPGWKVRNRSTLICMEYLPTFSTIYHEYMPHVGKYSIHGQGTIFAMADFEDRSFSGALFRVLSPSYCRIA